MISDAAASGENFRRVVQESARLGEHDSDFFDSLLSRPIPELEDYIAGQREAIRECRRLLHQPCHVVTEFDADYLEPHMRGVGALRELTHALRSEAWLHWRQGCPTDAADCALDILRLGLAMRNGGLKLDFLVGVSVSAHGIAFLRKRRDELDEMTAARTARTVLEIERQQEPLDTILARDEEWERVVNWEDADLDEISIDELIDPGLGSVETQHAMIGAMRELSSQPSLLQQMELRQDKKHTAKLRLLALEMALAAYRQSHSRLPRRLKALPPDLLDEIPLDPFSGKDFVYRRNWRGGYQLHSIGPGACDNSGSFTSWLQCLLHSGIVTLDEDEARTECRLKGAEASDDD